jgi:hypothetical protein
MGFVAWPLTKMRDRKHEVRWIEMRPGKVKRVFLSEAGPARCGPLSFRLAAEVLALKDQNQEKSACLIIWALRFPPLARMSLASISSPCSFTERRIYQLSGGMFNISRYRF